MIRQLRVLLVSIFLIGLGLTAFAQNTQIQGQVADNSGAVITKALVRVVDQRTGTERRVETNGSGQYIVPGLVPSLYKVFVQAKGFSTAVSTPIILTVGQNAVLDFKMQVGQASQTITVNAGGLEINTTDGSVGTVINRQFVQSIPLNGRSFQDLILLTPGVVTQSPQASPAATVGNNGDFSVNGQRAESNYYTVDGVSADTSASFGNVGSAAGGNVQSSTALGTTQSLVSVDALQEFRVSSSTYSAEYGRSPGGQFSFVTRSGTNDFHGDVFDYLRNSYFDANNWFTDYYGTAAPALRQNDFGGTPGGPIDIPYLYNGKDKTFFFFSYEGLRLTQPQPAQLMYVPSMELRQNANLPAAIEPILNAFPLPTPGGIDYGTGLAQFIQTDSLPSQIDSTSIRVDEVPSSNLRLFFRYSDTPSSSAGRYLSVYEPTVSGNQTYTLGATTQLSHDASDEFRLGYSNSHGRESFILDAFGGAQPINLETALAGPTTSPNPAPEVILLLGGNITGLPLNPTSGQMHQWNLVDTLSILRGHHSMKAGIDYRNIETTYLPNTPSVDYLYTSTSQLLSNAAISASAAISAPKLVPTFREFSAFVQDEWRVSQAINLSFGLRWEVDPPPGSGYGPLPYTLSGSLNEPSSLALAPQNTPLWDTTWCNLAPRLGLAWLLNPRSGHTTVFRAGGGVFFDTGNQTGALGFQDSPGNYAIQYLSGTPAPFPDLSSLTLSTAPPYTSTAVYAPYKHLQLPYALEWSAAIEQAVGQSQSFTISYVASNGRRLLQENEFSIQALNPDFGTIIQYTNGPTSNYQSLQTKFQRTLSKGLQVLASYTWSHAIDYGSNFFTIPLQRGNSDFDVRNSFAAGFTWQTPLAHSGHIANALFNSWELDGHAIARSGFPVNITGNETLDPATGAYYYGGVDLVPSQPIYLSIHGIPGNREINRAAFSLPPAGAIGNAPRNFVRGFGATQMNLAINRDFRLHERLQLHFRAEGFNIFNHPVFGTVDARLTDSTFGQATNTLNQSLATTSSLYQMGGPRSMQFALKLTF